MLVLNLAVADFLMGIYLIMLGIAGAVYDQRFCANELIWRSSSVCTTMGILVVLSSETSVSTMVLLTAFRLYAILNVKICIIGQQLLCLCLSYLARPHNIPVTCFATKSLFKPLQQIDISKYFFQPFNASSKPTPCQVLISLCMVWVVIVIMMSLMAT